MEKDLILKSGDIVGKSYAELGYQSLRSLGNEIKELIDQRKIPKEPWQNVTIKIFLAQIAAMDSNNYKNNCGVGEREGRIYSEFVRERNFDLAHGIGRSGDVNAIQPKAIGSSLVVQLTKFLTLHAFKIMGLNCIKDALVLPLATGMSLSLTLLTLKDQYPEREYVIFSRIDQKTCLKAIKTANLTPIVVDPIEDGDELITDVEQIEKILDERSSEILCVYCTTSCFAPRGYDKIIEVAQLCKKYETPHFINNAYGLQCGRVSNDINLAVKKGRVDVLISSTDKNFMVPVGGSIIYGPKKKDIVEKVNKNYPGRASGSAVIDLFLTLLQMGEDNLRALLKERKENFKYLFENIQTVLEKYGERVLISKNNKISMACTLKNLPDGYDPTFFGSYMFSRRVSGLRVLKAGPEKEVGGVKFKNYGSHSDNYSHLPFFTVAAAIGGTQKEIDVFLKRLDEALAKIHSKPDHVEPEESKEDCKEPN
ncbi:unnamed protein product [Moneuplotes crassus]|uniref:O-phosphoseryl-tRNA(Sec) selenium transferase n=1 Tax=Euplotes crassus TaxID=5936 RepID=A0AAD1XBU7_EUPCR|nr:unnamed protein product [Moneuplotes crassus]